MTPNLSLLLSSEDNVSILQALFSAASLDLKTLGEQTELSSKNLNLSLDVLEKEKLVRKLRHKDGVVYELNKNHSHYNMLREAFAGTNQIAYFVNRIIEEFSKMKVEFAFAGGMVAAFYRNSPRATRDFDVMILSGQNTDKTAIQILKHLGLKPKILTKSFLEGGKSMGMQNRSSPTYIVATDGDQKAEDKMGLDIILPVMSWTKKAAPRARENKIDFGFGPLSCLTAEDLIIAKLNAIKNWPARGVKDIPDLQSIFDSGLKLDMDYLRAQMDQLRLTFPKELKNIG